MSCSSITLTGIGLDCGNYGGLKKVYIAPIDDVASVTVGTDGEVSAMTMESTKKFKEYSFRNGNANFQIANTRDDAAGTAYFETTLQVQLNVMDKVKRADLDNLSKGNFYVIALDMNGIYWLIGHTPDANDYAYGSVTGNSGAKRGDANMYSLEMKAQTSALPYTVLSTVVSGII